MPKYEDKGGGKVDWESYSLRYVLSAITSAQKRQGRLWSQLSRSRRKDGLIPVEWPLINEYVESVRRSFALMIDLETVCREYEAKFGRGGRRAASRARPKKKAAARRPR